MLPADAPSPFPPSGPCDLLEHMPAALLVEFEGVLVETRDARRDALMRALADDGLSLPDDEYDARCAGLPVREAARAAAAFAGAGLDETALDLLTLRAERDFAARIGTGVTLALGAAALLDGAAGRARLALVTRASRREVEFVLTLAGLEAAFECVVAADDAPPKPSPAPYRRALERLSRRRAVRAADSLALEDGAAGAVAARAAGVPCVVVAPAGAPGEAASAVVRTLDGHSLTTLDALVRRADVEVPA